MIDGDWIEEFEKCLNSIEINVNINDQMDVCVQLKKVQELTALKSAKAKIAKGFSMKSLIPKNDNSLKDVVKQSSVSGDEQEVDISKSSDTNLYYFEKGFHNTDDLQDTIPID